MAKLTVVRSGERQEWEVSVGTKVSDALAGHGLQVQKPCGGRGFCGKCAVELSGEVSPPNEAEKKAGVRLACQAVILGDAEVILPESREMEQIAMEGVEQQHALDPMPGKYGAAVDIGTTTLAMKLYDLTSGECVGGAGMRNPQTAVAADVMGRIDAALKDQMDTLNRQIRQAIDSLLEEACAQAGISVQEVETLVVTGNTTMLYLLTGRSPVTLSRAPFEADCLFDEWEEKNGRRMYLPPCMNAFVGADITCAVLSCGQCESDEVSLLCDVGTNGEIALWKEGVLYISSTAAGPAFEGAGISCGCGSIRGAIDKVWLEDGELRVHAIGEETPAGLCGSGLIDAIAAFLKTGDIDETGAMEEDELTLSGAVTLIPQDVRAVQLAKAAIAAGIQTLLETAGVGYEQVKTLYIAGGFGSHLNVESAAAIGLFPQELTERVRVVGNAALSGAASLLLNRKNVEKAQKIAAKAEHVRLGGNPHFNENYMEQMFFPEEE